MAREVGKHRVVLYFAHHDDSRGLYASAGHNRAQQPVLLAPIAPAVPAVATRGREFLVVQALLVDGVEQVLYVVFDNPKQFVLRV